MRSIPSSWSRSSASKISFGLGPGLEVLAGGQPDGPPVLAAPLHVEKVQVFLFVESQIPFVPAIDARRADLRPVDTVGRDGRAPHPLPEDVGDGGLVSPVGIRVRLVTDDAVHPVWLATHQVIHVVVFFGAAIFDQANHGLVPVKTIRALVVAGGRLAGGMQVIRRGGAIPQLPELLLGMPDRSHADLDAVHR